MKITTMTFTRRMPKEQYGYEELTCTVEVSAEENSVEIVNELKAFVNLAVSDEVVAKTGNEKISSVISEEKIEVVKDKESPEKPKKAEKAVKAENAEKPKKEKPSKNASYDRNKDSHKAIFVAYLASKFPDWKKDKAALAKEISINLEGTDFLDESGKILPSFTAEMDKALS